MASNLLPDYYKNSSVFQNHLEATTKAFADVDSKMEFDRKRFFATLTEALTDSELDIGIDPDTTLTPEFRRARILARLRTMPYATKQKIIDIGEAFWSGGVDITEDNPNYKITLDFLGGQPPLEDLAVIRKQMAEIIPAHLWFGSQSILSPKGKENYIASPNVAYLVWKIPLDTRDTEVTQ